MNARLDLPLIFELVESGNMQFSQFYAQVFDYINSAVDRGYTAGYAAGFQASQDHKDTPR